MKKRIAYVAVLLVTAVFMSGCATMFTEKTQKISFKTKPDKAEVAVGAKTCDTPCTLEIEKGKWQPQAILTKPGHDSQTVILSPSIEPWFWANMLNMGFGCFVDYISGAYLKYDSEYYIPLTKKM